MSTETKMGIEEFVERVEAHQAPDDVIIDSLDASFATVCVQFCGGEWEVRVSYWYIDVALDSGRIHTASPEPPEKKALAEYGETKIGDDLQEIFREFFREMPESAKL